MPRLRPRRGASVGSDEDARPRPHRPQDHPHRPRLLAAAAGQRHDRHDVVGPQPGDDGRDCLRRAAQRNLLVRHRPGLRQLVLSECALAAGLRHADVEPGRVVVATKWLPILKPARDIPRSIDERIQCMSPYPIDLYQVHIPWSRSSVAAQMREMAALVRAGKVRAVGVSNFSAKQMAQAGAALQAEGLPLASNQVRINLLDRAVETNGVLDLAREHRVTLIAYSPLAQGLDRPFPRGSVARQDAVVGAPLPAEWVQSIPDAGGIGANGAAHRGAPRRRRSARRHARPGRPDGGLSRTTARPWSPYRARPSRGTPPSPPAQWTCG